MTTSIKTGTVVTDVFDEPQSPFTYAPLGFAA